MTNKVCDVHYTLVKIVSAPHLDYTLVRDNKIGMECFIYISDITSCSYTSKVQEYGLKCPSHLSKIYIYTGYIKLNRRTHTDYSYI